MNNDHLTSFISLQYILNELFNVLKSHSHKYDDEKKKEIRYLYQVVFIIVTISFGHSELVNHQSVFCFIC